MGAVHGVVLKYVGLTAVASAALALTPNTSYARYPLVVVAVTNLIISALFIADRGTFLLGKDHRTGRSPLPYYAVWAGFVVPTWLYTKIHTVLGTGHGIPEATEVAGAGGSAGATRTRRRAGPTAGPGVWTSPASCPSGAWK
ncbi:hypothetical protein JL721_11681 [Aureococcus anophagefferens]|nr:hypothetical protein JL721_11681 [Aureococcus anophagefferens]